jgi:molecular chaperone IbpA
MTLSGYQALLPRTVGFDRLLSTLDEFETLMTRDKQVQTYPPYNVVKYDDDRYKIEIAVAGFSRSELDITVKENKLTVTGAATESAENATAREYVHRGIGKRDFVHTFTLAETVVVEGADIVDGLLNIELRNVIPEEKQPRKIEIGQTHVFFDKNDKQLLTEKS